MNSINDINFSRISIVRFLIVFLLILQMSINANAEGNKARYGVWEKYSLGHYLKYPDFKLFFTGMSEGSIYPGEPKNSIRRMGFHYNYIAECANEKVDLSWSTGTGEIGPIFYTLCKQEFVLEMLMSDIISERKSDEYVLIWLKSEWSRAKQNPLLFKLFG